MLQLKPGPYRNTLRAVQMQACTQTTTKLLHPFNGLFSRTTQVSQYEKGKTSLDLNKTRDDGLLGWKWH